MPRAKQVQEGMGQHGALLAQGGFGLVSRALAQPLAAVGSWGIRSQHFL